MMYDINSPTGCRETIADHCRVILTGLAKGPERNRLVRALSRLDQKIAEGKQEMLLAYKKVTDA